MKEEVRRENDMEGWLRDFYKGTEKYHQPFLIAVVVIALAFLVSMYYQKTQINAQKKLWDEFAELTTAGENNEQACKDFAQKNLKTIPGSLLAYTLAAREQNLAIQTLAANDAEAAKKQLTSAKEQFQTILNSVTDSKMKQMTLFALAKNSEYFAQIEKPEENTQLAMDFYGKVAAGNDTYAKQAKDILDFYKQEQTNIAVISVAPTPTVTPAEASASQDENTTLDAPAVEEVAAPAPAVVEPAAAPAEAPAPAVVEPAAAPAEVPAPEAPAAQN